MKMLTRLRTSSSQLNTNPCIIIVGGYKDTLLYLTFSFTLFKMEFNPLAVKHMSVSKQLSTVNSIFKAIALTYFCFSEGIEKVPQFYILFLSLYRGLINTVGREILITGDSCLVKLL